MEASNKGKIIGVSLGPGDPWLITVKGLEVLKNADKVFYPGSLWEGSRRGSYSKDILSHYNLDENKLEGFYLRMNGDIEEADKVYEEVFQRALELYKEGQQIVIVSEGDAGFYSTFIYLLYKFQNAGIPVEVIPGVSSVMAAAAVGNFPLAIQNENIAILPRINDINVLTDHLQKFETVVIIKFRSVAQVLIPELINGPYSFLYAERVGTENQYITRDLKELENRDIPYFSLLVIRKRL